MMTIQNQKILKLSMPGILMVSNVNPAVLEALNINKEQKIIKILEQRGKMPIIKLDKARKALPPGKRISAKGKVYFETRKNRSDKLGTNL